MQPGETLEEIVEIAQRVESSLKETKREVNVTNVDTGEVPNLEELEAATINRRPPFRPNPNHTSNAGGNTGGNIGGKCCYCDK